MGTEFTAAREATKGLCNFFITSTEPIQIRLLEDYLTVIDFYLKTKRIQFEQERLKRSDEYRLEIRDGHVGHQLPSNGPRADH